MQITAPTSTSVNKFSIYGISSPSTLFTTSFSFSLSVASGEFDMFVCSGTPYSTAASFSGTTTFSGLQFVLSGSGIATNFRSGSGWSNTGLTTTGIVADTALQFSLYANNGASTQTYTLNERTTPWQRASGIFGWALP